MGLWIDVENSSGVKYGSGPIITATAWRTTESLDAMGSFSFSMPAADPQAALLASKRRVRCFYAPDNVGGWPGEIQELGYGVIDRIAVRPNQGGPTMLDVSGSDILVELANTSVGDLKLYTDDLRTPDLVKKDVTGGGSTTWTPGANIDIDPDPLSYIVVEEADAFISMTVTLGASKNTTVATLKAQYFNEAATPMGWENVDLTDGTVSAGKPFAQNGTISWEIPSGWGKVTYGTYSMRFYCDDADLTTVTFNTFKVTVRNPTATALTDIMAVAPTGWTLDPEGELATATTVLQTLTGQSALAALGWLAEQTGEHFIKSPSGRRVMWLGTRKDASGLHAVDANPGANPDPFALYIKHCTYAFESARLFTRIIAKGGGNGAEQITLADASNLAWSGYTLNTAGSWIERDAGVTEFGRIDNPEDFPDIVPVNASKDARKHAGNMLLQRALERLLRGSYEQIAYELTVIPSPYRLLPGQTIWVSYHRWVDGYHEVNVERELWVLDVTTTISASGEMLTTGLTVALVDTYPIYDHERMAAEVKTAFNARMQPVPQRGLTCETVSGVPYFIGVTEGKVTTIKRERPVADGTYTPVTLEVRNGVLVDITE